MATTQTTPIESGTQATTQTTPMRVTRTVYRYTVPCSVAVPTADTNTADSTSAPTTTNTLGSVAVPTTQGRVLVYVRHPASTIPLATPSCQLIAATASGEQVPPLRPSAVCEVTVQADTGTALSKTEPTSHVVASTFSQQPITYQAQVRDPVLGSFRPDSEQKEHQVATPPTAQRTLPSTTPPKVVPQEQPTSNGARIFPGGEQESDLLERMPVGMHADVLKGSGTDHVQLVSLGCMCAPKLSFQQLGRGSETLPFDWMRSRMEGILHFMRSDFEGFYDYTTVKAGCGGTAESPGMTMFRSKYHSFWHDNPNDNGMREKYTRRIARFKGIDAREKPVLFVRAANSTDELCLAGEVAGELARRFGPGARLLLIVDFQYLAQGPITVEELPENLLIYYHKKEDREPAFAPYMQPVKEGLLWAAGSQVHSTRFGSLKDLAKMTKPEDWGYRAHGDVDAFEPLAEADCNRQKAKDLFASAGSA